MKTDIIKLSLGAVAVFLCSSALAQAKDLGNSWDAKEHFQVRARAIGVMPDEKTSVNIGGTTQVDNAVVPEVDLSYFFTPHIAAELIAATSKHTINYNHTTKLGDAWVLPPTLTVQYHFTPDSKFSPYVGAGLNYSFFYGEDTATGFNNLQVEGGLGYALQAGADYWLNDHWGVNADVKKLWLNVDGKLNNGAITTNIDLDPWIVGVGVSYRF